VITGDVTQVDLPRGQYSGLKHAIDVLSAVDALSFNYFQAKDVVRHPVVQKIVIAYEAHEKAVADAKAAARAAEQADIVEKAAQQALTATADPVTKPARRRSKEV
jgi:phosphate starvation-inducible PhoH-like protein